MAARCRRISPTNGRTSPDSSSLFISAIASNPSAETNACMHAMAQFFAEKKSRNAANNQCVSHATFRIAPWEECEMLGQYQVRISRTLTVAEAACWLIGEESKSDCWIETAHVAAWDEVEILGQALGAVPTARLLQLLRLYDSVLGDGECNPCGCSYSYQL